MSATPPLPFVKMNGLGNEIVVVDLRGSSKVFTPQEVAAVAADRSSRFDQMMVLHAAKTSGTEAYVRIYNADGSEAGACGNGMRCVGWLLAQAVGRNRFQVETARRCARHAGYGSNGDHRRYGRTEIRLAGHPARRGISRHARHRTADRPDR